MKNLTLKTAFLIINAVFFVFVSNAQSIIDGNVVDEITNEVKPFVTVILNLNDEQVDVTTTNAEGYFFFENVKNGAYNIVVTSLGATKVFDKVNVNNSDLSFAFKYNDEIVGPPVVVTAYRDLLVKEKITKFDSELLETQKPRVITDIVKTSVATVETSEGISIKGARPGTAVYYIDGVRTYGDLYIPMSAVRDIEIYSGGVPAQYGNSTSGVIVVETKSYFDSL